MRSPAGGPQPSPALPGKRRPLCLTRRLAPPRCRTAAAPLAIRRGPLLAVDLVRARAELRGPGSAAAPCGVRLASCAGGASPPPRPPPVRCAARPAPLRASSRALGTALMGGAPTAHGATEPWTAWRRLRGPACARRGRTPTDSLLSATWTCLCRMGALPPPSLRTLGLRWPYCHVSSLGGMRTLRAGFVAPLRSADPRAILRPCVWTCSCQLPASLGDTTMGTCAPLTRRRTAVAAQA